jgi:hypothetical protein
MVPGARMVDTYGRAFAPWPESTRRIVEKPTKIAKGGELKLTVARLNQRRHIVDTVDARVCESQDRLRGADTRGCRRGVMVDLFPATTLYLTATVVDPNAKHWDPKRKRYVSGPVTSHLFYQIAGRRLDLNKNGVDDYLDRLEKRPQ